MICSSIFREERKKLELVVFGVRFVKRLIMAGIDQFSFFVVVIDMKRKQMRRLILNFGKGLIPRFDKISQVEHEQSAEPNCVNRILRRQSM